MTDKITKEVVEDKLIFLAQTDQEHAELFARVKANDERRKLIIAKGYLESDGTNMDREKKAHVTDQYKTFIEEMERDLVSFKVLDSERNRAIIVIELYRTECANQRRGNI